MDEIQDLFVSGRHGYHTFRIPALAVSTAGTVLAFAEGRRHDRADTGDIDTVLRRRERGAPEFDALRVVVAGGGDVAGNPAPVVDRDSGRITLLFCRNPHDGPEDLVWQDKAERTVWLTHSDDDGKTWASLPARSRARSNGRDGRGTPPGRVMACSCAAGVSSFPAITASAGSISATSTGAVRTFC